MTKEEEQKIRALMCRIDSLETTVGLIHSPDTVTRIKLNCLINTLMRNRKVEEIVFLEHYKRILETTE